jgi:uncharacterized protein YbbC (DUF1343 family)
VKRRAVAPLTIAGLALIGLLAPTSRKAAAQGTAIAPGIEVLLSDSLHLVRGKRVGLITNHTARDREGRSSIDLLFNAPGVRLTALFGPEHGIRGVAVGGAKIASTVDSATGVPIYSLYGETRVPTEAMLRDVDVLLYDIQDVGARAYTYVWTMALAAERARKLGKVFVVLDRPNPIRDDRIEGGMMEPRHRSFVGLYPVPLRYGLTPGELLRYLTGTGLIVADAKVVPMRGYRRSMWLDDTGLPWVSPSPNIRRLEAALLYPGTVFFEATNVSEGRGTDQPLELSGAPWLTDAAAIVRELNALHLPGVRFDTTTRTIGRGEKFAGRTIPMIAIRVTDRDAIRPVEIGVRMLRAIRARHPSRWRWQSNGIEELSGSRRLRVAIEARTGAGVDRLLADWRRESAQFERDVAPYRLYPE